MFVIDYGAEDYDPVCELSSNIRLETTTHECIARGNVVLGLPANVSTGTFDATSFHGQGFRPFLQRFYELDGGTC